MHISILLMEQIIELFIMILMGGYYRESRYCEG